MRPAFDENVDRYNNGVMHPTERAERKAELEEQKEELLSIQNRIEEIDEILG